MLSRLWQLPPQPQLLARLAAALGADVPACLASGSVRMAGIGEQLTAAPDLPACGILARRDRAPSRLAQLSHRAALRRVCAEENADGISTAEDQEP